MKARLTISLPLILFSFAVTGQSIRKPLNDTYIFKTNILGLIPGATLPTISFEKIIKKSISLELSYVNGAFEDFYDYNGFLVRAKNYLNGFLYNEANIYIGTYLGMLRKDVNIQGSGPGSFVRLNPQNFKANSFRGGATGGFAFVTKGRFIMDVQTSIGVGAFTKFYRRDPVINKGTYFDFQLWGSIGYCF